VSRLWSCIYGGTLVLIGIGCGIFAMYQVVTRYGQENFALLAYSTAMLAFLAIGGCFIGVERIRGREAKLLRPLVKPDEWLVENYGPRGKRIVPGSEKPQ